MHRSSSFRPLVLFAVIVGALPAQNVNVALSALTPLTATTSVGPLQNQSTFPIGPMGPSGLVSANTGGLDVTADLQWISAANEEATQVSFHTFLAASVANGASHVGPNEVLVRFSALQSTAVSLRVSRSTSLDPGAPWPELRLDFGNDGSIDVVVSDGTFLFPVPNLGSQVFDVRVVTSASLASVGAMNLGFSLAMVPDNRVNIAPLIAGCDPSGADYLVTPTFVDQGVKLSATTAYACVHVLGLSASPVLLLGLSTPCVLVPTPDILIYSPTQVAFLPLPAAVRPVTFHAQGVVLSPIGALLTLDGFSVTAF